MGKKKLPPGIMVVSYVRIVASVSVTVTGSFPVLGPPRQLSGS